MINIGTAALIALLLVVRKYLPKKQHPEHPAARGTLEQKLQVLSDCGFNLASPFTVADLLESWSREEYEKPGFNLVLFGLGMTEERRPWRNHCVNLWHFDTECIEDEGSYKIIAERMAEMAQGSFPLKDIQDHVDLEKQEAWVSFTLNGQQHRIDCKVDDDWVDGEILGKFQKFLKKSDPSKVYVYYDMGGQDCMIGCVTREQYKKLVQAGIGFVLLT